MTSKAGKHYLVLSHILGKTSLSGHIVRRVFWEQEIVRLLALGHFSPFHLKKLKVILGVQHLRVDPVDFLLLLLGRLDEILSKGRFVLVIDDLDALSLSDPLLFAALIEQFLQKKVLVLLESSACGVMLLRSTYSMVPANDPGALVCKSNMAESPQELVVSNAVAQAKELRA